MIGERFDRLVVLKELSERRHGKKTYLCICDCGNECSCIGCVLRMNRVKSCGCLPKETKHGHARGGQKSAEYLIWGAMRQRCRNPRNKRFPCYGGRGISVCERWNLFENFISDMRMRPTKSHSIDRIDNDGDYEPNNCRWATPTEQARNTRRSIYVDYCGKRMPLKEACEAIGVKYGTIICRIHRGQSPQEAIVINDQYVGELTKTVTTIRST